MRVFWIFLNAVVFADAVEHVWIKPNSTSSNSVTSQYLCADEVTWISQDKLCDGIDDCADAFMSDECGCSSSDDNTRARCGKWQILQHLFPHVEKNLLQRDEERRNILECIKHERLVNCSSHPGSLQCDTPGLCVIASAFCDNQPCCPDKADEKHIGFGLKCQVQGGPQARDCLLPNVHLNDAIDQCTSGAENCRILDNDGNWGRKLKPHCFECINREHIILADQVCDGVLDCSDFSDECLCDSVKTPEVCQLMYEEQFRPQDECQNDTGREITCGDGTCISKSLVCDGKNDCLNGIDEIYCYSKKGQYRQALSRSSAERNKISCLVTNVDRNETRTQEATMCNGKPECDSFEDECVEECFGNEEMPPFCELKRSCVPGRIVCNGVKESQLLPGCNFTHVPAEEENCPRRFYCSAQGGTMISIDESLVCDGVINCDDGADEAKENNCGSLDGRFYCESSNSDISKHIAESEMRNRSVLFVARYKIADGTQDCNDGSDECPTSNLDSQVFSSTTEMIVWTWLRAVLWINALIAITGNLSVLIFSLSKMRNRRKYCCASSAFACHHILVFNLSISDLLMGIYLTGIAIASSVNSGHYCSVDRSWRLSDTCIALGILGIISSEVSVYIMLGMAILRCVTIRDPLFSRFSSKSIQIARTVSITGWVIAIVVAILPVVHPSSQYFRYQAFVQSPLFMQSEVTLDDITVLARKIKTASDRGYVPYLHSPSTNSPYDVESTVLEILPNEVKFQWLSIYGKTSICLPGIFRQIHERGWEYCLAIIIFNLTAFCIMIVLYVLIIKATRQSQQTVQRSGPAPIEYKLMKRVTVILITDFLCWAPICVIFFLYLFDILNDPVAFAIAGIILLPINSALNPIIYAGLPDMLITWYNKFIRPKPSKPVHVSTVSLKPLNSSQSASRGISHPTQDISKANVDDPPSQSG